MTTAHPHPAGTAEYQSEIALASILGSLQNESHFRLDAGAGAGKTYSLVQALRHIVSNREEFLPRADQKVACLTYTKVARDEIIQRTDGNPSVFCDTLHGFLWEMIQPFQKQIAASLSAMDTWAPVIDGRDSLDGFDVTYDLGIRGIKDNRALLHHDDIPTLAIKLFALPKFRAIVRDRFPVIFIDEYQDTPQGLIEAMMTGVSSDEKSAIFGFFGDHWQQIYDKTCGLVRHDSLAAISKHANFRSGQKIVSFLNSLRPELPQAPAEDAEEGSVTAYHTNNWPGQVLGGAWKGQISHEASHASLTWVQEHAEKHRWKSPSTETKVLMLTHTALANELGYGSLPGIYKYNEAFAKKSDDVIAFFIDLFEPAIAAFEQKRYGDLFEILGRRGPLLRGSADKRTWMELFNRLQTLRSESTVGDVLDTLLAQRLFSVPDALTRRQRDLTEAMEADGEDETNLSRRLLELKRLRAVPYSEIMALAEYVNDETVFSTKHNVKGAEFDNVIVVLGRGWTTYDFSKMIDRYGERDSLESKDLKSFERSRNLFYVACSRPKQNLVLLFTQQLSPAGISQLEQWIGEENVVPINFEDVVTVA